MSELNYKTHKSPNRYRDAIIAYNLRKIATVDSIANKVDVDLYGFLTENIKYLEDSCIVN